MPSSKHITPNDPKEDHGQVLKQTNKNKPHTHNLKKLELFLVACYGPKSLYLIALLSLDG